MYFRQKNDSNTLPDYIRSALSHSRQHDTQRTLGNSFSQSLRHNYMALFQRSFIHSTTRAWNRFPEYTQTGSSLKKSNREILERLSNPRHPTNLLLILDEGWQHFAHQITSGMSDLSAHLYYIQNVESPTALADIHLKQYTNSYFIVAFMQKLDSNYLKQSQPFTERFLSSTTRFTSRHSSSWLTSRCNRSARSGTSISKIDFQNTMF